MTLGRKNPVDRLRQLDLKGAFWVRTLRKIKRILVNNIKHNDLDASAMQLKS